MKNNIVITFSSDMPVEDAKKYVNSVIEDAYKVRKDEAKLLDDFIRAFSKLVKLIANEKKLDAVIDNYCAYLLKQPLSEKRTFYRYYKKCVEEAIDNFVGMALENKKFSLDKSYEDEK